MKRRICAMVTKSVSSGSLKYVEVHFMPLSSVWRTPEGSSVLDRGVMQIVHGMNLYRARIIENNSISMNCTHNNFSQNINGGVFQVLRKPAA
jgi:hypothetical protein